MLLKPPGAAFPRKDNVLRMEVPNLYLLKLSFVTLSACPSVIFENGLPQSPPFPGPKTPNQPKAARRRGRGCRGLRGCPLHILKYFRVSCSFALTFPMFLTSCY